jgi:hypothetical protein
VPLPLRAQLFRSALAASPVRPGPSVMAITSPCWKEFWLSPHGSTLSHMPCEFCSGSHFNHLRETRFGCIQPFPHSTGFAVI